MLDARSLTKALGGRWQGRYGLCRCPAHADREPSLKIRDDDHKSHGIDVHCFAGCGWKEIKDEWQRQGLLPQFAPGMAMPKPKVQPVASRDATLDDASRIAAALEIWNASTPLREDTLALKYFTETRGLHIGLLDLSHCLRWHEGLNTVVALMTDPVTNQPVGIHRTFLNPDGTKRERKMLGRQGVVRLSRDEDVTQGLGIAEGIEDALAILIAGWAPVWAATSAGGIERFTALDGIEFLTIFADNDATGRKAAEGLRYTLDRGWPRSPHFHFRGNTVKDWNDAHRAGVNIRELADKAGVWKPEVSDKRESFGGVKPDTSADSISVTLASEIQPKPVQWLWERPPSARQDDDLQRCTRRRQNNDRMLHRCYRHKRGPLVHRRAWAVVRRGNADERRRHCRHDHTKARGGRRTSRRRAYSWACHRLQNPEAAHVQLAARPRRA